MAVVFQRRVAIPLFAIAFFAAIGLTARTRARTLHEPNRRADDALDLSRMDDDGAGPDGRRTGSVA